MALFGMHYDKPGPGISKDEHPQAAPLQFFAIYTRHFWDLLRLNLIYAGCCIVFYLPLIITLLAGEAGTWIFYVSVLPIILTGPFTAGFTHVLRDFARERPVFLWADFKDATKQNVKQSLASAAIMVLGGDLFLFLILFYSQNISKQVLMFVPLVLVYICAIVFLFLHYYVFAILITFDMPLKKIYRNAFLFAFLGLWPNFLITIFAAFILFVTCILIPFLSVLLPLITLSTIGFLINFCVWRLIKKYMLDPHPELMQKAQDTEPIFRDSGKEK